MKIRVEISSLATAQQSGVASYTQLLTEALARTDGIEVYGHFYNFLNRQPRPRLDARVKLEENKLVPLRGYAKAHSYGVVHPFDLNLPKVDLTIFPNFATWNHSKTKLSATTIHDLTYLYYPELVEEKNLSHLRRVVPRSIKHADIILTVSDTIKQELVKEFGISPDKCISTPIPPDEIFFQRCNKADLEAVRSKYNIGNGKYIYFIGNFEPRKNLAALVKAYQALPDAIRNEYKLVLAGGKGWKSEATQQAVESAVAAGEQVQHIGYVDAQDRPALYQAASLFVMPSIYEGFGIPVLEAMASECPVVAADIPVLRETGGDAALYADTRDLHAFAEVIEKALKYYPFSSKQMINNVKRFSWEKNVSTIVHKVGGLLGD